MRRLVRVTYVLLASVALFALLAELGYRAWDGTRQAEPGPPRVERVGYQLHPFLQMTNPPRKGVEPGPDLAGWRVDPPGTARAEGRTRILFLGGAATGYPARVRAALEPSVGPITAYDLSADWHSSLHSLYKFWTYVDEIEPDLVVVQHAIEDFYRGFTPPRYSLGEYRADYSHYAGPLSLFWTPAEARSDGRPVFHAEPAARFVNGPDSADRGATTFFRDLAAGSELLRALRGEAHGPGYAEPLPEPEYTIMFADQVLRALPAFERNMRNLRHGCRTKQVRLLMLTMPFRTEVAGKTYLLPGRLMSNDDRRFMMPADFEFGMRAFNAAVVELATPKFSYTLDLAPQIREREHFSDEVHLSEAGEERQAELVAAFVRELELLPSAD